MYLRLYAPIRMHRRERRVHNEVVQSLGSTVKTLERLQSAATLTSHHVFYSSNTIRNKEKANNDKHHVPQRFDNYRCSVHRRIAGCLRQTNHTKCGGALEITRIVTARIDEKKRWYTAKAIASQGPCCSQQHAYQCW